MSPARRFPALLTASFLLSASAWIGWTTVAHAQSSSSSSTSSRTEEKKQKVLDYKKYEMQKNQEMYGQLANEKRKEAIDQLKKILDEQQLPPDTKAEMLMRLAELYWEQSKYEYSFEMSEYDKKYEEWFNKPEEQQKTTPEPKIDTTKSLAYTRRAIENYRLILANYPNYKRIDEALFFLAFSLNDISEDREALEMYSKLVKTYPKSDFVPDSYNAIGEYYFNNNNAFKALQAYKKAAEFKDSKIYTFALYKMAWCYYNVGEFTTAIDTMKELVAVTDAQIQAGAEGAGISLKDEALKDLVTFFAELGDLEAAKEYFTRYGEKRYYRQMLARLGGIYMDQGKNELAIQTYRTLIAEEPYAQDNPDHQNEIIKAYWSREKFDEANEEINKLVDLYGRESRWAQENKDNKNATKESERLIEKNLRNVAIDSHQQALKRKSAKLLLLAEENYKRYLDYFPAGGKAYEMRYWYAEVLYKLKKFDVSTDEYEKVVDADAKGKFLKDAAINTIFSIEAYIGRQKQVWDNETKAERDRRKKLADPKEKYAPIALRDWESRLIKACDTYGRVLPDEANTLNILYKAAYLLYEHNEFNQANDRFLKIIRANPKSELAQFSVHIILDSYGLIENWTDLNKVAREFYNNPDVGKTDKFKSELKDIYQNASFKIAEGLATAEKKPEAAKAFEDFVREFTDSQVRDLALYNAAFWYGQAGDKQKMVTLRTEFVDTYPKPAGKETATRQLYEKSLALLADHYQSVADFAQAGRYYRTLFDRDKKFALDGFTNSQDALYNAALFAEAAGDLPGAIKHFQDYLAAFPTDKDVLRTRLRIAGLQKEAGKIDEAVASWKSIYSDKAAQTNAEVLMEARLMHGRVLGQKGDIKGQHQLYRDSLKLYEPLGKGTDLGKAPVYAAEMQFELLEPRYAEYAALTMPEDTRKAAAALDGKIKAQVEMEKAYVDVLNLKAGEWGIAALYRIGTLYANLAKVLVDAPCPKKLNEDQCFIYKAGLQDRAYPIGDKAVEAFGKARDKSYELGLYTAFTVKSLEELSKLRPEEYPAAAEDLPEPTFTASPFVRADLAR